MRQRCLQCWQVLFLPLFLIHIVSQRRVRTVMPYAWSRVCWWCFTGDLKPPQTSWTLLSILADYYYYYFANGPGDLGSIPGRVIPKTLKMVLDTTLLNTQHYKVRFKGKVEQSWEWSSALPYWCSSFLEFFTSILFFLEFFTSTLADSFLQVFDWEQVLSIP